MGHCHFNSIPFTQIQVLSRSWSPPPPPKIQNSSTFKVPWEQWFPQQSRQRCWHMTAYLWLSGLFWWQVSNLRWCEVHVTRAQGPQNHNVSDIAATEVVVKVAQGWWTHRPVWGGGGHWVKAAPSTWLQSEHDGVGWGGGVNLFFSIFKGLNYPSKDRWEGHIQTVSMVVFLSQILFQNDPYFHFSVSCKNNNLTLRASPLFPRCWIQPRTSWAGLW